MKVKISKTIGVHQIPNEIRRMLDQIKNNLVYGLPESMNKIIAHSHSSEGEFFFKAIDDIDSFRQDLAALDESLQEVHNILGGYKKFLMPIQEDEEIFDEEWLENEMAESEKRASQHQGLDNNEGEHEEG